MSYAGARLFSAVFRSVGVNARECEESDERTLELGGLYTSGEECYPAKITIGDFLRIIHSDDFKPDEHAFFMPTANGPCRFGQYSPYLQSVLQKMGYGDVPVISPNQCQRLFWHGRQELHTRHDPVTVAWNRMRRPADKDAA